VPRCRLYWSDPGTGSISYAHLSTREKRVLVAAEYSAHLYGITVFQVLNAFLGYFIVILIFLCKMSYKLRNYFTVLLSVNCIIFLNYYEEFYLANGMLIQSNSIISRLTICMFWYQQSLGMKYFYFEPSEIIH